MRHTKFSIVSLFPAIMAIVIQGCGKTPTDDSPLNIVPASARVVATINLDNIFRQAGYPTPTDATGNLKPEAERIIELVTVPSLTTEIETLIGIKSGVDQQEMILFQTESHQDLALFNVIDADILSDNLTTLPHSNHWTDDGFNCYQTDNQTIVFNEHYCWIAPDLETVKASIEAAKQNSIFNAAGINDFLKSDHSINAAFSCSATGIKNAKYTDNWICASVDARQNSISLTAKIIDRDGTPDSIGAYFDKINTEVLRFIPDNAVVTAAFGQPSPTIQPFLASLQMLSGTRGLLSGFDMETDGTTAFHLLPAGKVGSPTRFDITKWNLQTIFHIPQEKIDNNFKQLEQLALPGVTKSTEFDRQWEINLNGSTGYIGSIDNYLIYSFNRPIADNYNNTFEQHFKERRAAIVIDIPSGSQLQQEWDLPCGLSLVAGLDTTALNIRLSFYGSDNNAIVTLLEFPNIAGHLL